MGTHYDSILSTVEALMKFIVNCSYLLEAPSIERFTAPRKKEMEVLLGKAHFMTRLATHTLQNTNNQLNPQISLPISILIFPLILP